MLEMAFHSNGGIVSGNGSAGLGVGVGSNSGGGGAISGEYSGDERDSRSGGEERLDNDLNDKPVYLLEHLATFTVNKDSGIVYPADGMRRLLQLEKTTGIWSQKMQLCLDYQWILIMDYETGNIIERFPAMLIQEPTAFTSADAMDLYNNILVFIVSGSNDARSEMHIFQSQNVSAVHLVEDLKSLRSGKAVVQQRAATHQQQQNKTTSLIKASIVQGRTASNIEQQQQQCNSSSNDHYAIRNVTDINTHHHGSSGMNGETDSEQGGGVNDETSSISSDKYERDVTVLNHCFDDIEKFIARLQHAAAASRELERRRRNRKTKKKDPGEGLLTLRTRPPYEKEFIDIFAKFKLSFNLLAKLKAHIHDPNAPELVHFLFTPLALIVEASSDTYFESQLPARVVNPLLTREAINLLINCVTSKETELWRSLGDAWIIPRDQWKEDVGSYHPVFLDGWSPDYLVIDELEPHTTLTTPTNISKHHHHSGVDGNGCSQLGVTRMNGRDSNTVGTTITAPSTGVNYDDNDSNVLTMLCEKYTIHYGHGVTNERLGGERSAVGTTVGASEGGGITGGPARNEIDSIGRSHHQHVAGGNSLVQNVVMQSITGGMQNLHARDVSRTGHGPYGGSGIVTQAELSIVRGENVNSSAVPGDKQVFEAWLDDLQAAGAKIVLVTYPRTANNDKELSVVRGEYLQILDDTRKWWKARNIHGQIAHVPHTIVTPYNYDDTETNNQFYGHQQQNNFNKTTHATNANGNSEQRSNMDTTDWLRNKHLGKKGEFRYF